MSVTVFFHGFLNSDIRASLSLDFMFLNVYSIVLLIVGKLLNLASEVVILELVSKCFPVLLWA